MTITAITLENFQTIAEPTRIELSELVMLFGPNSSGKSAISDALAIVVALCRNNPGDPDRPASFIPQSEAAMPIPAIDVSDTDLGDPVETLTFIKPETAISRSWRRTREGFASSMKLGVEGVDWLWRFHWHLSGDADASTDGRVVAGTAAREVIFDYADAEVFSIASDSSLLINGELTINLRHGGLDPCVAEIEEIISLLEHKTLSKFIEIDSDGGLVCKRGFWDINRWREMRVINWAWSDPPTEFTQCARLLQTVFEKINELITIAGVEVTAPYEVSDSRSIPAPSELTYLFGQDMLEIDNFKVGVVIPDHYSRANPAFRNIATGFALKLDNYWVDYVHEAIYSTRELDEVNRLLSDFMFVDNGYQIDCEHVYLISEDEAASLLRYERTDVCGQLLVKLCLRDGNQNKFDFTEVGSGLGYSLPVLAALANRQSRVVIRQPELHLHPALQAAMGDAVLQSAKSDHRLLIETHSEHMTLRILKRIRQVSEGKVDASEYPSASPEAVRVYYFEPQADDSTKVHHLRISQDGDFLDPWPSGFFEERYEDLFDE